jgi:hypothetical protein
MQVAEVDMQAVVDDLAAVLGQSVLIEDRKQYPLWWSTLGAVDQTRTSTILDRRVDPKAAEVVRKFGLLDATAPVHTPAMPERGMWARWCMPIRSQGRVLGFVWVLDPNGDIETAQLPGLIECAEMAADVLMSRASPEDDAALTRARLIDRLMNGHDAAAAVELAILEHLPHDALVQVAAPARPGGWVLPAAMSAHVVRSQPRLVASGTPLLLADLGEAARRAAATRRAIAAGAAPEPPTWDFLGAWRLVVDAPESLTVAEIHPGVEALAAHARPDLLETARTILDHAGDIGGAAARLHVHRTTLYYRLDRIAQLTGVDLRTSANVVDLQLALWLHAYRSASA